MTDEPEPLMFDSGDAFRTWLVDHQDSSPGVWLTFAKKGSGTTTVTYAEALDAALEHGWIDGQTRRIDDQTYVQRFTPRRPQSPWSLRNRTAAEAMIAEGRMAPRGLAEVERARADGRWKKAYEGPKNAEPHPDFLAALEQSPAAAEFYATLNSQNRYAIYFRVQDAKRADTRARRIEKFVGMLARGEKFHP
ncbi:YdeI/OmpD-associated family protein [Pengzhenrongella sp.]|uniref:YdeI/OmpD-associated family protein n=1 Tax=Pengzhenrongella sp. TaxID=2888820 RepID=UPI002F93DC0B